MTTETAAVPTEQVLRSAVEVARTQPGGALATMHAEDGTPYVTYVLFHLRDCGEVLFPSMEAPQHARNLEATPECSMLIDNRAVVQEDASRFSRIVVEGRAQLVPRDDPDYPALLEELRAKSALAGTISEQGRLYRIRPRRLVSMTGYQAARLIVDFEGD
jgi:putative heme iron utilization protein